MIYDVMRCRLSIASIFLKFVYGMVEMDGIGFGGEAIIRTGED